MPACLNVSASNVTPPSAAFLAVDMTLPSRLLSSKLNWPALSSAPLSTLAAPSLRVTGAAL